MASLRCPSAASAPTHVPRLSVRSTTRHGLGHRVHCRRARRKAIQPVISHISSPQIVSLAFSWHARPRKGWPQRRPSSPPLVSGKTRTDQPLRRLAVRLIYRCDGLHAVGRSFGRPKMGSTCRIASNLGIRDGGHERPSRNRRITPVERTASSVGATFPAQRGRISCVRVAGANPEWRPSRRQQPGVIPYCRRNARSNVLRQSSTPPTTWRASALLSDPDTTSPIICCGWTSRTCSGATRFRLRRHRGGRGDAVLVR